MVDYETIDDIMKEPEHAGLTRFEVFEKPFVGIVQNYIIKRRYESYLNAVESDTARIPAICYWNHEKQNLAYDRDYIFSRQIDR